MRERNERQRMSAIHGRANPYLKGDQRTNRPVNSYRGRRKLRSKWGTRAPATAAQRDASTDPKATPPDLESILDFNGTTNDDTYVPMGDTTDREDGSSNDKEDKQAAYGRSKTGDGVLAQVENSEPTISITRPQSNATAKGPNPKENTASSYNEKSTYPDEKYIIPNPELPWYYVPLDRNNTARWSSDVNGDIDGWAKD